MNKKINLLILAVLSMSLFMIQNQGQVFSQSEESSNSSLQPEIELNIKELDDIKEVNLVDDFGAIPNDGKDDSEAIQAALDMATKEPIRLIVPEGEYLSTGPGNIEATGIKGLQIRGDNAVFKPKNPMINPPEYYFLKLFMAEENAGVEIEGITIDGSLNPQDLFFTLEDADDMINLQLQRGIYIRGAKQVSVSDTTFQHMYGGYGLHLEDYDLVNIKNVRLDDVGGDDITDSFGMAFYLSGHTGDAVINIDNVHAIGKVSDRDPSYSAWIGVVIENGSIQSDDKDKWLIDENTTVNVTNSSFMDYETTFHVESMAGNVYFNAENIETRAKNYFISAGINGEMKSQTNKLNMEMTPWGRNELIYGLYYSEKERDDNIDGTNEFEMHNSRIRYQNVDGVDPIPVATSYGDSVVATYYNTTFQEVPAKLVTNASAHFIDSQINLYIDNQETAETLAEGPFSDSANQSVTYEGSTSVNIAGSHLQAQDHQEAITWFGPTGHKPDALETPLEAPLNNLTDEQAEWPSFKVILSGIYSTYYGKYF